MMCKNSKDYFITNVNYIEMNKEDYFTIINNERFLFKQLGNIEILNTQKLEVLSVVNLATDSLDMVDWLSEPQVNTLRDFTKNNPETLEEGYYLLNLGILSDETKEVLKKLSFSAKIEDTDVIANIYSNILNVQTNDYFEYLDRLILVTNNLHIDENDLVDYVNEKIKLNVEFRTITRRNPSGYVEGEGYQLEDSSTVFILMVEKLNQNGDIIY